MNKLAPFKKYLLWFANEHLDFRLQEITSIASLLRVNLKWIRNPENDPFWILESKDDEDVKKLASRSVTLRYVIELWSWSSVHEEFHRILRTLPSHTIEPYIHPEASFKIKVEVYGSSQTQNEKVQRIESFRYLPFKGPVKLKNPDLALQYIEYYGQDPSTCPQNPYFYYFGRIVAPGQRDLITNLSLKTRKFIGNTSMDPQLSLIMANQALVSVGSLVLDPFVGSGSLVVAAAQFGGYILGSDIDYLMLHGKTRPTRKQDQNKVRRNENILANLKQYGLSERYVDVIVSDFSLPLWNNTLTLDAIITDPPYGVREAVERIGTPREDKSISDHHLPTHIPSKIQYSMAQLLHDLLSFAAKHLTIGGRLVTWIPVIRLEYEASQLPKHSCLRLVGNSEQILSTNASRRLLTFEKIYQPQQVKRIVFEEDESFRKKYSKYIDERRKSKMESNGSPQIYRH